MYETIEFEYNWKKCMVKYADRLSDICAIKKIIYECIRELNSNYKKLKNSHCELASHYSSLQDDYNLLERENKIFKEKYPQLDKDMQEDFKKASRLIEIASIMKKLTKEVYDIRKKFYK